MPNTNGVPVAVSLIVVVGLLVDVGLMVVDLGMTVVVLVDVFVDILTVLK